MLEPFAITRRHWPGSAPVLAAFLFLSVLWAVGARADTTFRDLGPEARALVIDGVSADPTYGFSPGNPILLGGLGRDIPPSRPVLGELQQAFFGLLRGPNGQTVRWRRRGACCPSPGKNLLGDQGLIDTYLVGFGDSAGFKGQRPVRVFIDHYRRGPLKAPIGFLAYRNVDEFLNTRVPPGPPEQAIAPLLEKTLPTAHAGSSIGLYMAPTLLEASGRKAEADMMLRNAAEAGVGWAQYLIWNRVERGQDIGIGKAEAIEWLKRAAVSRYPDARQTLGYLYRIGQGVPKDVLEGVRLQRLAAEQGVPAAQVDYGMAWILGIGVPKRPAAGMMWLLLAAKSNDRAAAGLLVQHVKSVGEQDMLAAFKAADAWVNEEQPSELLYDLRIRSLEIDPTAMRDYALELFNGALAERDPVGAYQYAVLAERLAPSGPSRQLREMIGKPLTGKQRAAGKAAADSWNPETYR